MFWDQLDQLLNNCVNFSRVYYVKNSSDYLERLTECVPAAICCIKIVFLPEKNLNPFLLFLGWRCQHFLSLSRVSSKENLAKLLRYNMFIKLIYSNVTETFSGCFSNMLCMGFNFYGNFFPFSQYTENCSVRCCFRCLYFRYKYKKWKQRA